MCGRGSRRGNFSYILGSEDYTCRLRSCSSWYRIAYVLVVSRPFLCQRRYCRCVIVGDLFNSFVIKTACFIARVHAECSIAAIGSVCSVREPVRRRRSYITIS